MINTIEDTTRSNPERLKYKIFNFIKPSGKMFTLDVNERKQKFSVPDLIQVAELDMRVKKNIEQITYTYEEFYTSYFRSFSIDLDVTIPIPIAQPGMPLLPLITPSFGYHNTLKTAYDFITKTSAAVGIATDWWGMYTIHLGPTFLLTKKGNGQTSGSITEINVNLGLFDDIAGLHGTFSWGSSDTRLSKDFKKNSAFEWKFLPSVNVTSDIDENIMKAWLERASKKPTVINRTLSSIVNLLSDYPSPIRRHLQSTIDFYLKHAHLPKLEELKQNTNITRSKRASAATSKSIPAAFNRAKELVSYLNILPSLKECNACELNGLSKNISDSIRFNINSDNYLATDSDSSSDSESDYDDEAMESNKFDSDLINVDEKDKDAAMTQNFDEIKTEKINFTGMRIFDSINPGMKNSYFQV
ncbi:unnamed protein product [Rotaria sp. Silwood1]|nr:unnamed protein product [Rotaria sp. Silwood1]